MGSTEIATNGVDTAPGDANEGELRERLVAAERELEATRAMLKRLEDAGTATAEYYITGLSNATTAHGIVEAMLKMSIAYVRGATDAAAPANAAAGVLFIGDAFHMPTGTTVGTLTRPELDELWQLHPKTFELALIESDGRSFAAIAMPQPSDFTRPVALLAIEIGGAPEKLVEPVLQAITLSSMLHLDRVAHITEARYEAEHAQAAARIQLRLVNPIQRDAAMAIALEEIRGCSSVASVTAVDLTGSEPRMIGQFGELALDAIMAARRDTAVAREQRLLILPIVIDGDDEGLLVVQTIEGTSLSEDTMFAGVAAALIGSVSRFRAATTIDSLRRSTTRQLVEAQERDRAIVAADIHDGTLQQLGATAMRLELLRARANAGDPQAVDDLIDRCAAEIRSCTKELRNLLMELRPQVLDDNGLAAALGELGRSVEDTDVHVRCDLPPQLEDDYAITIFRIVQEALNNVRKHAHAINAWVEVSHTPKAVHVEVRDDGVGFEGAASGPSSSGQHFGLLGMRERARMMGGEFSIVGHSGGGTIVSALLPTGGTPGKVREIAA